MQQKLLHVLVFFQFQDRALCSIQWNDLVYLCLTIFILALLGSDDKSDYWWDGINAYEQLAFNITCVTITCSSISIILTMPYYYTFMLYISFVFMSYKQYFNNILQRISNISNVVSQKLNDTYPPINSITLYWITIDQM